LGNIKLPPYTDFALNPPSFECLFLLKLVGLYMGRGGFGS